MSRARVVALVLAVLAVCGLLAALSGHEARGPTVAGREREGLRLAYRYLEQRGWPVHDWGQPLNELPPQAGVLVISLPLAVRFDHRDADALRSWLLVGGAVAVLAHGPDRSGNDRELLDLLGIVRRKIDAPAAPRLADIGAWAFAEDSASPASASPWTLTSELRFRRLRERSLVQAGEQPLWTDDDDEPVARLRQRHGGKLLLVDAGSCWTNAFVHEPGNLAFLEQAMVQLGGRGGIWFDEWHQGHQAAAGEEAASALPFDLLLGHLLLAYLAVVWALAPHFGARRRDIVLPRGSVDRDLRLLARLHARSGHARQAGQLLLRSARQVAHASAELPAAFAGGEKELAELGRRIGELQRDRHL